MEINGERGNYSDENEEDDCESDKGEFSMDEEEELENRSALLDSEDEPDESEESKEEEDIIDET